MLVLSAVETLFLFTGRWKTVTEKNNVSVAETRAGGFQISENFITRLVGGGCDQDASFKVFLVNGFCSSLRIMSRAGCCIYFRNKRAGQSNQSGRVCSTERLILSNYVAWQMLKVVERRVARQFGKWIYVYQLYYWTSARIRKHIFRASLMILFCLKSA